VHKLHARTAVGGEPAAFGRHSHVLAQLIALCIIMQRPERFVATLREAGALLSLTKKIFKIFKSLLRVYKKVFTEV